MPASCDSDLSDLEKWIAGYILHEDIRQHTFHGMGTGIQAVNDINENSAVGESVLVTVKPQRYFTAKNITHLAGVVVPEYLKHNQLDCLVAFLIVEDHLGERSSIYPYLKSIPRQFSNPLFLDQRIPTDLTTELEELLTVQLTDLTRTWKTLKRFFSEPRSSDLKPSLTNSRFIWAYFAVATRSLYLDVNLPALVPFVDLLNHSPTANTNTRLSEDGTFALGTRDKFKSGEQVFINYGSHSNSKLAVYYGFVADKNPFSTVTFDVREVIRVFQIAPERSLFLEKYGLMREFFCSWDGFSSNLRCLCRMHLYAGQEPWAVIAEEGLPTEAAVTQRLVLLLDNARILLQKSSKNCSGLLHAVLDEQLLLVEHCRKLLFP